MASLITELPYLYTEKNGSWGVAQNKTNSDSIDMLERGVVTGMTVK